MYVCMYIYIYIYVKRGKERDRERERDTILHTDTYRYIDTHMSCT